MKRKQLGLTFTKMYWLLSRNSKLTINNKLLVYKVIIKPIWCYGIQLWGTASNSNLSNLEILERFQSKVLRMIINAPWYVSNAVIRNDLLIPTVKEEIVNYSKQYRSRLSMHPNDLATNLMNPPINNKRLAICTQ